MPRRRRQESAATALGHRMRELRHQRGWSQERLAEEATMDRSYVAGIEVGARNPSLRALEKLAGALGVTIASLFGDEPA